MKKSNLFLFLFIFTSKLIFADWVLLDNDERLQGSLVELSKKELSIVSEQFGQLECPWKSVSSLQSKLSYLVRLKKGQPVIASFLAHEKKKKVYLLLEDETEKEIDLDQIISFHLPSSAVDSNDGDFSGTFSLAASDLSGNTNKQSLGLSSDLNYRFVSSSVHDSMRFRLDFRYGELNHRINERKGFADFQYKGKFISKFLWYFLHKLSFDHSQNLSSRFEENLGLSYPLWKKAPIDFSLKLGIARTDSNYKYSPNQGEFRYSGGWEFRWRLYRKVLFMQDFEYLPSSNSFSKYFLRLNHKLRVPLSFSWAIDLRHDWNRTHPAAISKRENDQSSSLLITYFF